MAVATLGRVSAEREARRIETGSKILDEAQFAEFKKIARETPRELIRLGDVILIAEMGDVVLVATVRTRARVGKEIALNGHRKGSTIPVLAIAAANFGEQA